MLIPLQAVLLLALSSSSLRTTNTRRFATQQNRPDTLEAPIFPDVSLSVNSNNNINLPYVNPDVMYIVTGASQGFGDPLYRKLLQDYQGMIVAGCHDPAQDLSFLSSSSSSNDLTIPLNVRLSNLTIIQRAKEEFPKRQTVVMENYYKPKKSQIYAVARGHQAGLFPSWAACEAQVRLPVTWMHVIFDKIDL